MDTYLEELEKLGRLRDTGGLTNEEFETEKLRLLGSRAAFKQSNASSVNRRLSLYVAAGVVAAILMGGGGAYLALRTGEKAPPPSIGRNTGELNRTPTSADGPASIAISFSDPSSCEASPTLADLLARVRE